MATATLSYPVQSADFRYPPPQGEWTFDDYLEFIPDGPERYEIIEGNIIMMAAPTPTHQRIVKNIAFELELLVRSDKLKGEVFVAPIDVVMSDVATPVQPDVCFIAADSTRAKVERTYIRGVPDLMVEVLSSDKRRDRVDKFHAYSKAGVAEYWIVDPEKESVVVYVLRGEAFVPLGVFKGKTLVRSEVIAGWTISAETLF